MAYLKEEYAKCDYYLNLCEELRVQVKEERKRKSFRIKQREKDGVDPYERPAATSKLRILTECVTSVIGLILKPETVTEI